MWYNTELIVQSLTLGGGLDWHNNGYLEMLINTMLCPEKQMRI